MFIQELRLGVFSNQTVLQKTKFQSLASVEWMINCGWSCGVPLVLVPRALLTPCEDKKPFSAWKCHSADSWHSGFEGGARSYAVVGERCSACVCLCRRVNFITIHWFLSFWHLLRFLGKRVLQKNSQSFSDLWNPKWLIDRQELMSVVYCSLMTDKANR